MSQDLGPTVLSLPEVTQMLPPTATATWNILTALPVAVFPSQGPGLSPAARISARLPTAFH